MDVDTIPTFLSEQAESAPEDVQHYYLQFEELWERKLWHELTNELIEFFDNPASGSQRIPLFNTFIKSFADKINQLKLVQLGQQAATQSPTDADRLKFLTALAERVDKPASQDAYVYALSSAAGIKLSLHDFVSARKDLDKAETTLEGFDNVENVVHASFYRVNAAYYQTQEQFASYYKNALLYLACIDSAVDLTALERQQRAYDLAIAALVSDSIYNFGELLLHPILHALAPQNPKDGEKDYKWLRDLLFAFNRGDLSAYELVEQNRGKDKLLDTHRDFLYKKIALAALTETVFRRPPHDRTLSFASIGKATNCQPDEVEHLVMKALALGLVRGTIDQVAAVARIHWVQPKVLDLAAVQGMRTRLREWDGSVNRLGNWIEGVGRDVWAA